MLMLSHLTCELMIFLRVTFVGEGKNEEMFSESRVLNQFFLQLTKFEYFLSNGFSNAPLLESSNLLSEIQIKGFKVMDSSI